jgi:D-glycerate 3-kinase
MDKTEFWTSLADWMADLIPAAAHRPVVVGLCAPQGAGKTTLTAAVCEMLAKRGIRAAAISIDDFYLTRAEQVALAASSPGNRYLEHRGLPGTHDVALGTRTLDAIRALGPSGRLALPAYDKSAFVGRGDRRPEADWPVLDGPLDVAIVEGWMLGFVPIGHAAVADPDFRVIDDRLAAYADWHTRLDAFIWLEPEDFNYVRRWRAEAEEKMIESGRPGMTQAEVAAFVEPYLAAYAAYYPGLRRNGPPIAGPYLHQVIGFDRLPSSPPAEPGPRPSTGSG